MRNIHYLFLLFFAFFVQSCTQEEVQINQITKDAALKYAQGSQKALGKGLMGAIKKHDLSYAISFCNDTAEILTQSISNILNVKLKRVSDKNRNPNNAANKQESAFIEMAKKLLSNDKKVKPTFFRSHNKITAYIPIMTKHICLNCHGDPATMSSGVLTKINTIYPTDKALNYTENELRGIWVVEMNEIEE